MVDFVSMSLRKILKQDKHFAIKLPIVFPYLITSILVKKYILTSEDIVGVPHIPLNFSYMLFAGKHVSDIVLPDLPHFSQANLSTCLVLHEAPPMLGVSRGHMLNEIMQVSKNPQEIISTSTTSTSKDDGLIQMMNLKVFLAATSHVVGQDA